MSSKSAETLFEAALALPPDQRATYLDQACGGDAQLRQRVEALLQVHEQAGQFLSEAVAPPPEPAARISLRLIEKAGDKIGHYKLLQQVGEGGCGVVYMAEQQEPIRRRVALKIIKLGMDTKQVIARFEAERQALALMDHPNIAKVLDAGATDTGRPYFVMELVRGIKITEYCDENNLSTEERLNLFMQVCHAIQHAHQKSIIHRDIKPSNILVTINDGVPVPKVIDFGIAKATGGQPLTDKTLFTAFEQFIGTPAYMSPEQAEMTSLDIDTRSDIYALGVLLYELLTGHTPFDPKTLVSAGLDQMRRIIREKEPPWPSTRVSTLAADEQTTVAKRRQSEPPKLIHQLRGDLDWIVMKCLEKDRTRRYETANSLAQDIEHHLRDEPVVAFPPSGLYQFQKLVRRNKLVFAAAGAVAAALTLGLGLSTWLFVREREARRMQSQLRQQAQTEAAKSQQVARFLKDMIEGVGPSVALGRDTTMLKEILGKTAERVGKDLTNQPEVELELCGAIGSAYSELGLGAQAGTLFRRQLELARKLYGAEHPAVADALFNLAGVLASAVVKDEPEKLYREALGMRRKLLGSQHRQVAESLSALGLALAYNGKQEEAESASRQALAIWRQLPGSNRLEIVNCMEALATTLWQRGKLGEAEDLQREALAQRRELLGEAHPSVGTALNNLGCTLRSQGDLAGATAVQWEALELDKKYKGPEHPDAVNSFNNLVVLLRSSGKLHEAEKLLLTAQPPPKGGLPHLLRARASWRVRDGRLTEAAADLAKLVEGAPDEDWDWCLLAMVLAEANNDPAYRQHCRAMLARFGATDDPTIAERVAKACLLRPATGADLEAACRLADTAAAAAEKPEARGRLIGRLEWSQTQVAALGQEPGIQGACRLTKGLAEFRRGRYASATQWARQVLASPGSELSEIEAYTLLARTCLELKQPDEARSAMAKAIERARTTLPNPTGTWWSWIFHEWLTAHIALREALGMQRELLGPQHPDVAQSLNGMSLLLLSQGQLAEAEAVSREALAINRQAAPETFGRWESDLNNLVETLRREGKLSEVEQLFTNLLASLGQPPRVKLFGNRAVFRLKCGRLEEAATDLAAVIESNPDDHWNWYLLAPVLAAGGNPPKYHKHCEAMLTRFGSTNDPVIAERTAKACLLLPAAGPDLEAASRLAELAVTVGKEHELLGFFQFAKALAEYRQGHFASAIEWGQKTFAKPGGEPRDAEAWTLLAMARFQLHQPDEARRALATATDISRKLLTVNSLGYAGGFHDVLMANLLLGEAKAMLKANPLPPTSSSTGTNLPGPAR